jgi:hypothetical protein
MEEDNENIFSQLSAFLASIGLGGLFAYTDGKPSGWLWEQIQNGVTTRDELNFALEQTPEFQQRFKVIFDMRQAAQQGQLTYVPDAQAVLAYEKEYVQAMAAAGVPSWFYDSYEDAHNAMRSNLSVLQVEERIERGFGIMQEMPVEVRFAFDELYGAQADGALLAAVLDPEKTLAEIDRAVRASQLSGFSRRAGLNLSLEQAKRFAQTELTADEIQSGIQDAVGYMPLTEETIGEAAMDITEETALSAGILGTARDEALLEQRLLRRQVGQRATGGGAFAGQSGITGASVV